MKKTLKNYLNQEVVLDTRSSWIYIGRLEAIKGNCAILTGVDVHDKNDTSTTKEKYLLDTRTSGIKENRDQVYVNLEYVISFSLLKDIKRF